MVSTCNTSCSETKKCDTAFLNFRLLRPHFLHHQHKLSSQQHRLQCIGATTTTWAIADMTLTPLPLGWACHSLLIACLQGKRHEWAIQDQALPHLSRRCWEA